MPNNNCKLHAPNSLYSMNARGEYGMYAPMCVCVSHGDFSFIKCEHSRKMLESAHDAINSVDNGWQFLKDYIPEANKGFMFSTPPDKLKEINKAISDRYDGHSGSSYGWTMRHMESIAKKGWDDYVDTNLPKDYQASKPVTLGFQDRLAEMKKIEEKKPAMVIAHVDEKISMARAMPGGQTEDGFAKNLFQTIQGVKYDDKCPHGDPYYACMSCSH